jgi:hypothetical protein
MHFPTPRCHAPAPAPAPRNTRRCPGVKSQPMTSCPMWASDFINTGIVPDCKATSILEVDAAPSLGAAFTEPQVAGMLVK